ncbi:MAG: phosphoribosylformylglycinamidine synthase [Selenomonadaceae bacterium]|nr:phosphoribosylformylglycinamidine synthase [Selenomonadaceae bacterium]
MTVEDLQYCQTYFRKVAKRPPTITELKVIDTYWSDHCRHTTFNTVIDSVTFEDGKYSAEMQETFKKYLEYRRKIYFKQHPELVKPEEKEQKAEETLKKVDESKKVEVKANVAEKAETVKAEDTLQKVDESEKIEVPANVDAPKIDDLEKPVSLMDLGTIAAKVQKAEGTLKNLDESDEINACSIEVKANVDGQDEDWLVMFKNETHNHPTEIEPFGGAATCLGGAIRDPLSGRTYVYQAMRITGAADPRKPLSETLPGKLPQKKIVREAAKGYSSYGNQIGLATGYVHEIYHEGYLAKRMEIGAVIAAAPKYNVVRGTPVPGDVVVLVGGRTGRDGIGGATGSSKVHTENSLKKCGAEVQKGNAPTERKIQRLFRNPKVSRLIKRCNDFGAGGVAVAVGELAAGLDINLDAIRKKYEGLDGTELALSESQERMAVVLDKNDVEIFIKYADEENLEAYPIAVVTEKNKLVMHRRGQEIVSVSRKFFDTNGVRQHVSVNVAQVEKYTRQRLSEDIKTAWLKNLQKLNVCSQKGLVERFDSTVGAGTVLMPFGGKNQLTPAEGMAAKLPVEGETKTATVMSYGFDAKISAWSPYHGAIDAVTSSLAKITAMGADFSKAYLTFQEYFEKLGKDPNKWGKPFAALLGAFKAQMQFGVAAIGGKDSMSGTYENLNVPPTLVSFAVAVVDADKIISPEFKSAGNKVYLVECVRDEFHIPIFRELKKKFAKVHEYINAGKIISAATIGAGGIAEAVSKMAIGNDIGFKFEGEVRLFEKNYGSLILEAASGVELDFPELGETTDAKQIEIGDVKISLDEIKSAWMEPREKIFPTQINSQTEKLKPITYRAEFRHTSKIKIAQPRVFIPVFPGTNCEYDSARVWRFAGAKPNILVVRNLTAKAVEESVSAMVDAIKNSQIIMIPGGFSAGDEPDGSGKFIAAMFRNPRIAEATMDLIKNRDGLILGICNGFQALVKLGLLPYGEIRDIEIDSPALTYNTLGRHVSQMVRTRVASNLSPWLANNSVGDVHTIAVSHGEGRFIANDLVLKKLIENGQIATQYVNFEDEPTYELPFNPNGSILAIEGITSADGRIFGKMGHSERIGENVCKNVPGNKNQHLFEAGVNYFS